MNIKVGLLNGVDYPKHCHKCYEIIIYSEGTGFFYTDKSKIPFRPGTIIVVPPGTTHWSISDTEHKRFFINGDFSWCFDIITPAILQDNSENEGLFFVKMIYRNRYKNPAFVTELINVFISHILQNIKTDNTITLAINKIIYEISTRFFETNLNINAILSQSGYAVDYIRAQFKKATGKTPIKFLTEQRISHACLLMEIYKNSISLANISEKCGYTDYIYFSRRFKEIMGISPQKYMQEH